MSENIEDRRGDQDPALFPDAGEISRQKKYGLKEWKSLFEMARTELIDTGELASQGKFPFTCPLLSRYRDSFARFGGQLKNNAAPQTLFPSDLEAGIQDIRKRAVDMSDADVCTPKGLEFRAALEQAAMQLRRHCDSFKLSGEATAGRKLSLTLLSERPKKVSRPWFGLGSSEEADCADKAITAYKALDRLDIASTGICNFFANAAGELAYFEEQIDDIRARDCGGPPRRPLVPLDHHAAEK